jgi:hypothetical protein
VGLVGGARDKMGGKMGVPVPAAKQLLQGSSSPLNLSHLLLVLRHWSHAKEGKVSQDGGSGARSTGLCCSFFYWTPRLDVGRRRICRDRDGKALQTWRMNSQSKERRMGKKTEERPSVSTFGSARDLCNMTLAGHQRPLPGYWLAGGRNAVQKSISLSS